MSPREMVIEMLGEECNYCGRGLPCEYCEPLADKILSHLAEVVRGEKVKVGYSSKWNEAIDHIANLFKPEEGGK